MANPAKKLESLLRLHRFELVSQKKHLKYMNPQGRLYIMSKTPSDIRAGHRMLATLKRIITDPPPTSEVIEEERQKRELEASITLEAQRKPSLVGVSGAGKGKKSKGCGIYYEPEREKPVPPTAEELAAREESLRTIAEELAAQEADRKRLHEEKEVRRQLNRFRKGMRAVDNGMANTRDFLQTALIMHLVRTETAQKLMALPKPERRAAKESVLKECSASIKERLRQPEFAKMVDEWVAIDAREIGAFLVSHAALPHWMDGNLEELGFPTTVELDAKEVRLLRETVAALRHANLWVPAWLVYTVGTLRVGRNRVLQSVMERKQFESWSGS